jgi:hypothetical protein
MLNSSKPVVAVTAVRTGCGKSQVGRHWGGGGASLSLLAGRDGMLSTESSKGVVTRCASCDCAQTQGVQPAKPRQLCVQGDTS